MPTEPTDVMDVDAVRTALRGQYWAALSMLREAIHRCPDDLWFSTSRPDPFCLVACNAAFFTRYFLHPNQDAFRPWPGVYAAPAPSPDGHRPHTPVNVALHQSDSREEVLAYVDHVIASLDDALAAVDLTATSSGFHWPRMSKLEHQLATLRRLQHHTARLIDRLSDATGECIPWRDGNRIASVS